MGIHIGVFQKGGNHLKFFKLSTLVLIIIAFLIALTYFYLIQVRPLDIGLGTDENTDEVVIDLKNNSWIDLHVEDISAKNEEDRNIGGEMIQYKLKSSRFNVTSDELNTPEIQSEIILLEKFKPFSLDSDFEGTNAVIIKDGSFKKITNVEVKLRVLGIFPLTFKRDFSDDPDI